MDTTDLQHPHQPLARHAQSPLTWLGSEAGVAISYGLIGAAVLTIGRRDYPNLHTILDTGMLLLSSVLAWLFWDMGKRIGRGLYQSLALSFAATSLMELIHVLVTVEWSGALAWIAGSASALRPATWPPSAYLLPIGIAYSALSIRRPEKRIWGVAAILSLLSAGLLLASYSLPYYSPPSWLGITRPTLVFVPLICAIAGWACWRQRAADRVMAALAFMAAVLVAAHTSMLYSQAPHDAQAMAAHMGKVSGYLIMLLALVQMGSSDMVERLHAERALEQLNRDLESRVLDRTVQLESTNRSMQAEMTVRRKAEEKAQAQLERLHLLHQITHAIGERQDLQSIFQVVIGHLEDSLPIDFGCVCLYDEPGQVLTVAGVGIKSETLSSTLAMPQQALINVDENGLSRCVRGELVYEPNTDDIRFPFPQRLSSAGLRSLVVAPLLVESRVFGVLVAARREPHSFSSGECEFLKQLSEHVALAAHQAHLYSALQQAYDDLHQTQQAVMQQERLRALGQMASGIAHDINNAISPVALYTESLLETEPNLSVQARDYLQTIQHAIEDVTHTVGRMREFYRQREPQLMLVPVNVNPLVRQVVDLTRARWSDMPQQRGLVISVVAELASDLPPIIGIESEIREALINLIFNGIDAMPDGGTLSLRTAVTADSPQHLYIEVADTGTGMDDNTRRHCLEPFFTTKGERGTGLGLAMVYGVAQRHGADIEITSEMGRGTAVRLSFSVATHAVTEPVAVLREPPRPSRLRILVVDDDPLLIKSLRDTLQTDGHVVTTANGGQAGIDAFRAVSTESDRFAVVITDLGMPYVDGRQVASAVKAASPGTPVILLTGWGQRLVAEGDVPLHVDRVLNKPPKLHELRAVLTALTSARISPS